MWKSTVYPHNFPMLGDEVLLVVNGVRVISGYYAGNNGAHYVWKSSRNVAEGTGGEIVSTSQIVVLVVFLLIIVTMLTVD